MFCLLFATALAQPSTPQTGSWVAVGPLGVGSLHDVAIHPSLPDRWAIVDRSGILWTSLDAGTSWRRQVGPVRLSTDEALLVEVEGRLGELLDDASLEGDPDALEDPAELDAFEDDLAALEAAARDAAAQVQSELEGDPWFVPPAEDLATAGRLVFDARGEVRLTPPSAPSPLEPAFLEVEVVSATLTVAASSRGPLKSMDGARTFSDLGRGLQGVPCSGIAAAEDVVLAACDAGLFRLQVGEAGTGTGDLDWIPLPVLVGAAVARAAPAQGSGSRWLASMVPQVTATYQRRERTQLDWDADAWTTTEQDGFWLAHLKLTWRPRGGASAAGQPTVFVVGDDVFVDDGTPSAAWLSRISRATVLQRQRATNDVVALYRDRLRLASRDTAELPLRQRVAHTLRVAEVDARLDALTGAAVSRWVGSAAPDQVP